MGNSVTLPSGAVVTSDMTPTERHNIIAKAHGAPEYRPPSQPLAGPVQNGVPIYGQPGPMAAPGTIGNKPAPPSPEALAAANSGGDPTKSALRNGARPTGPDRSAEISELQSNYQVTVGALDIKLRATKNPEVRAGIEAKIKQTRESMEQALAVLLQGGSREQAREAIGGKPPGPGGFTPASDADFTAACNAAAEHSDASGYIPAQHFAPALLYGYTLRAGVNYHGETLLKILREAREVYGASQEQVDKYLHGDK